MKVLVTILVALMLCVTVCADEGDKMGEITFYSQETAPQTIMMMEYESKDFVLLVDGFEHIRMCSNGDIFIRGEKCTRDYGVYSNFKMFLESTINALRDNQ